ncbi:MAG: DinB family protein, partial [Planctomycetota bacterium]|nr:DinB family protein [Planctomycetota bacterium]
GWFEMFSWRSEPARVAPRRWPPLAKVVAQLKSQHARLRSQIARLDPERLASPMPAHPGRTRGYAIVHGLHDEACHSGEIWLLRKLLRAAER